MSSTSPSPSSPVSGVPPPPSTVSPPPPPSTPTTPPPLSPPTVPSPPPLQSPPPIPSPPPPPPSPPPIPSPPPPPQSPPPEPSPPPQTPPPAPSPPPQSPPTVVSPPPPQSPPVVVSPPPPTASSPPPPENSPPPQGPLPSSPPPAVDPPPSLPPRSPPSDPPPNPTPPTSSPPPPPPPQNNSTPSHSPPPRPPRRSPPSPPATPRQSPPSSSSSPPPATNSTPPSPPFRSPPSLTTPPSSETPPSLQTSPPSFLPPPPFPIPPSDPNTTISSPSSSGGLPTGGTVAIALIAGLILVGIFGFAACCLWKRKKKDTTQNGGVIISGSIRPSPLKDSGSLMVQKSPSKIRNESMNNAAYSNSRSGFSYEELLEATDGFSDQNLLGEGGFGSVYKGNLSDGKEVAVKRLKIGGRQGEREFRSEVDIISRIHHRHLVSLVGYCIHEDRRLLVYEYVPNDTLYYHLHGQGRPIVDWATRVKIAIGAARGIAYLHEDCHPRIIHRDIKSSNILLDDKFEARVSDFGLAKLAMDANSHITTRVMGTFGYMAPEYATSGKLTEKSDIYSFGVVLLELMTGRKPVDTSQPLGEESLVEWARPLLSHAIETEEFAELADPRLEGNYIDGEMFRMIEAAAACVRHSAAKRPKMGQIVRAFDSILDLNNGMKVGESQIFDSAQQSEEIRLFQRMAFGSHNYSTDFFTKNSAGSEGNRANSS